MTYMKKRIETRMKRRTTRIFSYSGQDPEQG
jgi:hypothetical protein